MQIFTPGSSIFTRDFVEKLVLGQEQLRRGGRETIPCKLTARERLMFETAKETGFFTCSSRPNLENVWWRWCEVASLPFVRIHRDRKYADVSMDLLCVDMTRPEWSQSTANGVLDLFAANAKRGARYAIGTITYCEKIYIDKAEVVVRGLFEIGNAIIRSVLTTSKAG